MTEQDLDGVLSRYEHSVGEDFDDREEEKKVDLMNRVYGKNERRLAEARRKMAKLDDPEVFSDAVIGNLYSMAYRDMQLVLYEARVGDFDEEPFEDRIEMFHDAVDPARLRRLSEKADRLSRRPAELREVLDSETEAAVRMLINSTYSGTEVVKEGSSGESSDSEAPS